MSTSNTRTATVFAALARMGRHVEISQWWQDRAFDLYDQAAYDDNAPTALTLLQWLQENRD